MPTPIKTAKQLTVEEQRVIRTRACDEPVHRVEHVRARRLLARVRRIIGENDDILVLVPPVCGFAGLSEAGKGR